MPVQTPGQTSLKDSISKAFRDFRDEDIKDLLPDLKEAQIAESDRKIEILSEELSLAIDSHIRETVVTILEGIEAEGTGTAIGKIKIPGTLEEITVNSSVSVRTKTTSMGTTGYAGTNRQRPS